MAHWIDSFARSAASDRAVSRRDTARSAGLAALGPRTEARRIDEDVLRALAGPISRRRALQLAGGVVVASTLPVSWSPSPVLAQGGGSFAGCGPGAPPNGACGGQFPTKCGVVCCAAGDPCCCDGNQLASPPFSCCPSPGVCYTGPDGFARCEQPCPGGGDRCGPSRICCEKDQACEPGRGICCPLDADARDCVFPETACAQKVEDEYKLYTRATCRKSGKNQGVTSMREASYFALSCQIFAFSVLRRGRLDNCPTRVDSAVCGPGGRCDAGTGRCAKPDCGKLTPASAQQATAATSAVSDPPAGPATPGDEPSASVTAADATVTAVRRALRRRDAALQRDADRLAKAYAATGALGSTRAPAELVAALSAYRRDILAVRRSVAAIKARSAKGRVARAQVLKSLDAAAAGLESSRIAVTAPTAATAKRHADRAKASFTSGSRAAKRARAALGCGSGC